MARTIFSGGRVFDGMLATARSAAQLLGVGDDRGTIVAGAIA